MACLKTYMSLSFIYHTSFIYIAACECFGSLLFCLLRCCPNIFLLLRVCDVLSELWRQSCSSQTDMCLDDTRVNNCGGGRVRDVTCFDVAGLLQRDPLHVSPVMFIHACNTSVAFVFDFVQCECRYVGSWQSFLNVTTLSLHIIFSFMSWLPSGTVCGTVFLWQFLYVWIFLEGMPPTSCPLSCPNEIYLS